MNDGKKTPVDETDVTDQAAAGEEAQPCPCTAAETTSEGGPEGITVTYEGNMRTIAQKASTGRQVAVDGTTACGGAGEHLSPIDLFAAAYGSCVIMATEMSGRRQGLELAGSSVRVVVTMAPSVPPNIERIETTVLLPREIADVGEEAFSQGAHRCPIHNALDPRVKQTLTVQVGPESS